MAALSEFEVVVLFFDEDDLAPFLAELAIWAAFLIGEKLLLPHAVVAALGGFVEFPFIPKALEDRLDAGFMDIRCRRGPDIVFQVELLPEGEKKFRDPVHKFRRLDAALLGGLLHLLAVLVYTGEIKYLASTQALVSGNGVSEDFFVSVADVRGAIRVVDRGRDEEGLWHGFEIGFCGGRSGFELHFSTPGNNAGLHACGFGLSDLVIPNIKEGEAGPSELVVRAKLHGAKTGLNCFSRLPTLH